MTVQLSRLSAYLSFYCGNNHLNESDTAFSESFLFILLAIDGDSC